MNSCKHGCMRPGGTSRMGEDDSHNMGLNCMNCHSGTGTGDGCFVIGGTVYDTLQQAARANCTIELYTEPEGKGQMVFSLSADRKGNFYSGFDVNFRSGLFPVVISPEGQKQVMLEPITEGACNSCHGVSTPRIWVN